MSASARLPRLLLGLVLLAAPAFAQSAAVATPAAPSPADEETVRRIYTEALTNGQAYARLRDLVSAHPGRLAGSKSLEGAVVWARQVLAAVPADRVEAQEVMVPHWERGAPESVALLDAKGMVPLAALALGRSGATPEAGLTAPVIEVKSLDELAALGRAKVEGRIVFFNRPMNPVHFRTGQAYGGAVDQRTRGPAAAAALGAVGAVVRSMSLQADDVPHAGVTSFPEGAKVIPALALSNLSADRLADALAEAARTGGGPRLMLKVHARTLPDAVSHNVIGEIRGREFPDEVILVGGHLDSWDNTPGAHDDGAGVVQAIEVLRIFRALGLQPRHTLRCVLFTNEENGGRGGQAYAARVKAAGEKHLLALESDGGGFDPRAISLGNPAGDAATRAARWLPLFRPYGVTEFRSGHGGMDVGPLLPLGYTVGEIHNDSQRYFDVHHAAHDTIDAVNPRELHLGAAAMAALAWLVDNEGL
ncbi:M20/M25/M40 family metallo-hydrolase [Opitutus sp. ER46]|uniref:M20/M25/M40 family metallo-hydrolase n=1 Tax=Opitutus sp. ER46 TaxID=2161864 RepID=UPI000D31B0FF|nr:M20/M25/M40 family metallo-hydrolase [Opitutus sp. ER46]PTX95645.1 peptidase M28 family protein [Opitutus sp. ER46]